MLFRSADLQLQLNNALAGEAKALEELTKANEKIDQAWNLSHSLDHQGFIPGALDAWKRPVKQILPYDFSGNPGASATQYCNGWNDCGGYWSAHAKDLQQRLTIAEQRNVGLRAFACEMVDATFEGGSFDGGDIQDIAVKHGLLRIEPRNEECGEVCPCHEYGFPAECYRKTDLIANTK